MDDLLKDAAARAIRYRREIGHRPVGPTAAALDALARLDEPLPATRQDDAAVLELLDEVAMRWTADVLGLPRDCGAGFVTCATIANFPALAAARRALLARRGWDVDALGLFGAPPITVVVGEVHVSVLKARRARGVEVWAALRSLGRDGLADLVERSCRPASRFADGLRDAGCTILNDVVVNQVLVSFGEPEVTRRVIAALQADGMCWAGGTVWQGTRPCASVSRHGQPPTTTSNAASRRWCARRPTRVAAAPLNDDPRAGRAPTAIGVPV